MAEDCPADRRAADGRDPGDARRDRADDRREAADHRILGHPVGDRAGEILLDLRAAVGRRDGDQTVVLPEGVLEDADDVP